MKRLLSCGLAVLLAFVFHLLAVAGDAAKQAAEAKEALQAIQDYVGGWKGSGTSEKNKDDIWTEKVNWGWKFKGADSWLILDFAASKFFKSGEMRFLVDKKTYQLTVLDKKDQKLVFEGKLTGLKKDRLTLERLDPDSKETQQILMNIAGGGLRSIYTYSTKPENRTAYNKQWQLAYTREGESFAAAKKNERECVVTGGLGTMTVSYKGATYYVCCTGCRDAFNDNPEKILKEYQARKKAGN